MAAEVTCPVLYFECETNQNTVSWHVENGGQHYGHLLLFWLKERACRGQLKFLSMYCANI